MYLKKVELYISCFIGTRENIDIFIRIVTKWTYAPSLAYGLFRSMLGRWFKLLLYLKYLYTVYCGTIPESLHTQHNYAQWEQQLLVLPTFMEQNKRDIVDNIGFCISRDIPYMVSILCLARWRPLFDMLVHASWYLDQDYSLGSLRSAL